MFLRRVAAVEQAIRFLPVKVPNAATRAAMEEARAMKAAPASQPGRRYSMPSPPKPSSSKRASLPRQADHTKQFLRDWHQLTRSGRYNIYGSLRK